MEGQTEALGHKTVQNFSYALVFFSILYVFGDKLRFFSAKVKAGPLT